MLSKTEKKREMIQNATQIIMPLPYGDEQDKKPIVTFQSDIKLPSSHPFKSSQQIENNTTITHRIGHQLSQQCSKSQHNHWPKSCIGLVLCEHHQNNQTLYVYGTGTLIHSNIVLTSAQNVYCRRLNTQYKNIKFIVGVYGDKCSGIYDIMRVHYPKEYIMQVEYENHNFAVLVLYDDLSDNCGYVGWKTINHIEENGNKLIKYGYTCNQEGYFELHQITENEELKPQECFLDSGRLLIKEEEGRYSIVGIQYTKNKWHINMNQKIRNMINQWTQLSKINLRNNNDPQIFKYLSQVNCTHLNIINLNNNNIYTNGCKYISQLNCIDLTEIYLAQNNIRSQGCKYLCQAQWKHLNTIDLSGNKIGAQGCKYLIQSNWKRLNKIQLDQNKIGAQGCKYLSQADWIYLTKINLRSNQIGAQGCKNLCQTNWIHLATIHIQQNNIGPQGFRHLYQANWKHLNTIYLSYSNIGAQGCMQLSKVNWIYLTKINLYDNKIGTQGCKYLSNTEWIHLITINLSGNNIDAQGCKYLSQSKWQHLKEMDLYRNQIGAQGIKYLSQANWKHLTNIILIANGIIDKISRLLLKQVWLTATVQYHW